MLKEVTRMVQLMLIELLVAMSSLSWTGLILTSAPSSVFGPEVDPSD